MSTTRAVVLLHSSASSSRQWQALAERLGSVAEVLAIDLHGHGTQPPWEQPRAFELADDARLVIERLPAADPMHLVGHSYGGAVALKLASLWPTRVSSLIAYEPVMFDWLPRDGGPGAAKRRVLEVAAGIEHRLARGDLDGAAEAFVDFWSGPGAWERVPAPRCSAIAACMPSVSRQFACVFAEPLRPEQVALLTCPKLFLFGERTAECMQALLGELERGAPVAPIASLPRIGHLGPMTHAEIVNERIAAFLEPLLASEAPRAAAA